MSWKSFACLAALTALTAPAVAQPIIGLEDRGDNVAALTITTNVAGSLATNLLVEFSGGISLVDSTEALGGSITDPDTVGVDDLPFLFPDGSTGTSGLAASGGSIFASLGLGDQGIGTFDLLTFEFADFGTITASGGIAQLGVNNAVPTATLEIVDAPTLLGDFDGDGDVDGGDLGVFAGEFGQTIPPADVLLADFDGDGDVDGGDLGVFAGNFGTGTAPAFAVAVPEPSALALCLIATCGLIRRR